MVMTPREKLLYAMYQSLARQNEALLVMAHPGYAPARARYQVEVVQQEQLRKQFKALEGCRCSACVESGQHQSDCAVHNLPAAPAGPCDCLRCEGP